VPLVLFKQEIFMNPSSKLPRRQLLAAAVAVGGTTVGSAGLAEGSKQDGKGAVTKGDVVDHKVVYQLNRADADYQLAILNSIGAMLKKYVDDVTIAVVVFGPGLHLLAKKPKRPVPKTHQQRARGMSESYGVEFVACGNTMNTLGWTKDDLFDFVRVEEVGASSIMERQEKGYAYISW